MKSLYFLITVSLFSTLSVTAQNWSLVMPHDTLVYEGEGTWDLFSTVWVDSTRVTAYDTSYFMNRISPGKVIDTIPFDSSCANGYYSNQTVLVRELNTPQFCGAILKKEGAKWLIQYVNNKVVIYPESQVGSSWMSDSISGDSMRILSSKLEMLDVYLVLDSVKIFEINGKTFSLSKSHGLVTQLNFGSIYQEEYELVGVQNQNLGDVIPMGKDFFDYSIGDVFARWVGHANSDGQTGYSFKRKVVDKQVINDTLVYTYSYPNSSNTRVIKYWPEMNPMLNAFPNTIAEIQPIFLDTMLYDSGIFAVVEVSNYSNGRSVKRNTRNYAGYCLMDSVWIEYHITGPLCEYRLGLEPFSEMRSNMFESDHDQLEGYYVNGVLYGDTVLGVSELKSDKYFKISPNPASSTLQIGIEKINGIYLLEIYDLRGGLIITKTFERNLNFDVSTFQPGIYFAVIKDNKGVILYREKIVIQ